MPTGPRIRGNNVFGFITDNPLTAGAGTFNSPGLATLPPVAAAHAVVTLDPMRQFGEPEIVIVTAHSASATVATITRGAYGTVARSHPQNTLFVHAPIDEDVTEILTSTTRPTDPYIGQTIFETDTELLVYRNIANNAWISIGGWQAWSPTLSNMTLAGGTSVASYALVGDTVFWRFRFTLGAGSAMGTDPAISPPFTINTSSQSLTLGNVFAADADNVDWVGNVDRSGTTLRMRYVNAAANPAAITATAPFTWVSGDILDAQGFFERV